MAPPEPAAAGADEVVVAIEQALQALARRLMQGRLHEHFARQAGVDLDQAGLAVLYVLWEPGTSLRVTELAARLGIDTPAVTRKAQQLERQGLVSRGRDESDARASLICLTPAGQRALRCFLDVRHQWFTAVLAGWPDEDRRDFARLAARFTEGVHEQLDQRSRFPPPSTAEPGGFPGAGQMDGQQGDDQPAGQGRGDQEPAGRTAGEAERRAAVRIAQDPGQAPDVG